MVTLGHITLEAKDATIQDAFELWLKSKAAELDGPEGEKPKEEELEKFLWEKLRELRDELLKATDHLLMPDYPVKASAAMKDYRQALRDLPQKFEKVGDIILPEKPQD